MVERAHGGNLQQEPSVSKQARKDTRTDSRAQKRCRNLQNTWKTTRKDPPDDSKEQPPRRTRCKCLKIFFRTMLINHSRCPMSSPLHHAAVQVRSDKLISRNPSQHFKLQKMNQVHRIYRLPRKFQHCLRNHTQAFWTLDTMAARLSLHNWTPDFMAVRHSLHS
jgi:hypothetical protein